MPTLPDLAALLYFADLRELSLAARLTWHQDGTVRRRLLERHQDEVRRTLPLPRLDYGGLPGRITDEEWLVLVAPGGRYRVESPAGQVRIICDGENRWTAAVGRHRKVAGEIAEDAEARAMPGFRELLAPRWLVAGYDLRLPGEAGSRDADAGGPGTGGPGTGGPGTGGPGTGGPAELIGGRRAWRLAGVPRRVYIRGEPSREDRWLDRAEVVADAELGILLRAERIFAGESLSVAHLHDVVLSPARAADAGLFRIPGGRVVGEGRFTRRPDDRQEPDDAADAPDADRDADDPGPAGTDRGAGSRSDGPGPAGAEGPGRGEQAAETAAHLAAAAMGFAARHAPRSRPRRDPGDAEAAMPPDVRDGPPTAARSPASPRLIALLARAGLPAPALAAEFHQWIDAGAVLAGIQHVRARLPEEVDGILGPDALWDGIAGRADADSTKHLVAGLRCALPDRHRLDYRSATWRTRATAVACDGTATRRLFADRVAVSTAAPLRAEVGRLLDPAWLLDGWDLAEAGLAEVAGRPGIRVVAEAADWSAARAPVGGSVLEAIVDTEIGILLRYASWVGDRPAERAELRDLVPGDPAPGERSRDVFGPGAGSGLREVPDSAGRLRDRDLPGPVQAAGTAATLAVGGAIAGAVAVTGWLDKRRARRKSP